MNRRSLLRTVTGGVCGSFVPSAPAVESQATTSPKAVSKELQYLRDARWSEERAFQYMQRFKEVKGCNYVPSDASSVMRSPNDALIRRELGWASDVAGLNSVRVWVELADFQINADELYANFEKFLKVCYKNKITVLPVLSMTDALDPDVSPAVAAAERPTVDFHPSVHGLLRESDSSRVGGLQYSSRVHWPCCHSTSTIPAKTLAAWDRTRPAAEKFFLGFLRRYSKDERIIFWDLYNEAPKATRPYVETIFQWAREAAPSQPLSVCWQGHDLSDVITFHTYARPGAVSRADFLNELDQARAWGRPMLCTEWLARPYGNTVANVLPFFARYHIGWYVWGLCSVGPKQYQFPWNWPEGSPPPKEWLHCLLYPDGSPYSAEEILDILRFRYRDLSPPSTTQSYWRSWKLDINLADQTTKPEPAAQILSQPVRTKA